MKIDVVRLKDKMQTVTESLGFELADLVAPVVGGRLILRVFIFSPNGVSSFRRPHSFCKAQWVAR